MKKSLSLVLFCIILCKIGALALILEVCRETLRKQMLHSISEEKFDKKKVEILEFSPQSFQYLNWEKANKEFWYHSHLYDVIKIQYSGNKIYIYSIDDTAEKKVAVALHFINFKCKNHGPISQAGKIIVQILLQPIQRFLYQYQQIGKKPWLDTPIYLNFIESIPSGKLMGVFVPPQITNNW